MCKAVFIAVRKHGHESRNFNYNDSFTYFLQMVWPSKFGNSYCYFNYSQINMFFVISHTCIDWVFSLNLYEPQQTPCSEKAQYLKFLSGFNVIRIHYRLVRNRTLSHLANVWVLVYELSGSEFEFRCSHYSEMVVGRGREFHSKCILSFL